MVTGDLCSRPGSLSEPASGAQSKPAYLGISTRFARRGWTLIPGAMAASRPSRSGAAAGDNMDVLDQHQLDQVSGGTWSGLFLFCFVNLERINDSFQGLVDGFADGMARVGGDNGYQCTP
jgi:hypothetical protein